MRRIAFALGLSLVAATPLLAEQPPTRFPLGIAGPQLSEAATACPAQRPQACTQNYDPVCATKRDGTRQTYSNGCMACSDTNVVRHVPGPCN